MVKIRYSTYGLVVECSLATQLAILHNNIDKGILVHVVLTSHQQILVKKLTNNYPCSSTINTTIIYSKRRLLVHIVVMAGALSDGWSSF